MFANKSCYQAGHRTLQRRAAKAPVAWGRGAKRAGGASRAGRLLWHTVVCREDIIWGMLRQGLPPPRSRAGLPTASLRVMVSTPRGGCCKLVEIPRSSPRCLQPQGTPTRDFLQFQYQPQHLQQPPRIRVLFVPEITHLSLTSKPCSFLDPPL